MEIRAPDELNLLQSKMTTTEGEKFKGKEGLSYSDHFQLITLRYLKIKIVFFPN